MPIVLTIWAVAAIAGAVTAVVCFKKQKRPDAICDTCSHLTMRQDRTNPREGTYWVCDKEGRFSDPPEFCRKYHERDQELLERQEKIFPLLIQEHGDTFITLPMDAQKECSVTPEKIAQYVWE